MHFFSETERQPTLTSFASTSSASTSMLASTSSCANSPPSPGISISTAPKSGSVGKKRKVENPTMTNFLVRTSSADKQNIDKQIAKAIFATNSSFRCVENVQVKKAIQLLRPGYTPPSRKTIATTLLDEIYAEEKDKCCSLLRGHSVNMSIDGWSNVHNEPVVCATITTEEGQAFLYETIDTSGQPHTSEYLTKICCDLISSCESQYGCIVRSFVTDNAANMACMRKSIEEKIVSRIITYGCSAHILNLLCKDLEIKNIKENVVQVVKYFRNNHLASAKYKQAGGKTLVLPSDVRWNSVPDCLEMYVSQWNILLKVCEENKEKIDNTIYQKVSNIGIKRSAEEYFNILKPISIALDTLQGKGASLSDAVEQWKKLEYIFEEEDLQLSVQQFKTFQRRYEQALTPYHFIAYMVDPSKQKYMLTADEKNLALETINEMYGNTGLLPLVIKFNARSLPFKNIMFSEEITKNVSGIQWWLSQSNDDPEIKKQIPVLKQFLCAIASSASVERVFSTFGLVHSDLRNRLGVEKAGKLVFLFKYYNEN